MSSHKTLKGVVLAGGTGSRLHPLTSVTNKHLLPIYDRPMIYYPLQTLANVGVKEAMLITGGQNAGDFLPLIGDGSRFGFERLQYAYQHEAGGIAQALGLAEAFVGDDDVLVILGDNIIQGNLRSATNGFSAQSNGSRLVLTEVSNPGSYGVVELDGDRIVGIEEKPSEPKSDLIATGFYFYDSLVFQIVKSLQPSGRGELEITDVNNHYIREGNMGYALLDGFWADGGESIDSYLEAINLVATNGANDRADLPE
jgi:glucose-1-phosphate thymidylyltransferase